MVHSARGEPIESELVGGMAIYRSLLLVSSAGMKPLRDFAAGVIKWRADKDRRPGRPGRYALYRFKTDGGGGRGWWSNEGLKRARPAKSVTLAEGQLQAIVADVRAFLAADTKKWYIDHGLPHRRSYLFYGVPGAGKTSTIRALATEFKLNCCFLTITKDVSTQILGDALSQIPENALLVLEDVDALFNMDRKNEEGGNLSFSGLLNGLDGIMSCDGCITVLTTNHIDKLDSALIRGGRVDRRFEFCRPSQQQLAALFRSFYPEAADSTVSRFVDAVFSRREGDEARSIATLQQLFIAQRKESAEVCVDAIPEFFEMHFPNGTGARSDALYL
jgi:mitochondrial chaperone BCS1